MNDIIKAAARQSLDGFSEGDEYFEDAFRVHHKLYSTPVTHFLSFLESNGYAVVKVVEELNEIVAPHFKGDAKDYDVYPYVLDVARDALAIGAAREREKAMKFAEWASGNKFKWNKAERVWWNERTHESKSTSELWAMAEAEGVFTLNKEG